MARSLAIFDFDGTLADSFPWFAGVLNQVAELYGFRTVDAEEAEALRGCSSREIVRRLGVPMWRLPWIARHMRARMAQDIADIRLFPGVDGLLRRLSEGGVTIAVVTSNSRENVRTVLGPDNAARVAHLECGASLFGKAAKIRALLRRTGVPAADALCIGDETRDIEAARAAGLRCAAVSWGYATRDALLARGPDLMFDRLEDIAAALLPREGTRA
ncbi:HAD hydrolase-like protein [Azospirillum sp. SYSU D00513]|uniref:HAD hydrolase-like protein n=1 Tax=Azospirillum sp. SYSU D00513 TaxID=2812561 RepID=UPI001A97C0B3|nr:HAD hydrolase-like protein [Azospirillum sp. SYSU D00513]